MLSGVVHLEFDVGVKVGEGGIDGIGDQNEIDGIVGIALANAEGKGEFRHGQFFVGHPRGDFDDLVVMRVDVAGRFNGGNGKLSSTGLPMGFGQCMVSRWKKAMLGAPRAAPKKLEWKAGDTARVPPSAWRKRRRPLADGFTRNGSA